MESYVKSSCKQIFQSKIDEQYSNELLDILQKSLIQNTFSQGQAIYNYLKSELGQSESTIKQLTSQIVKILIDPAEKQKVENILNIINELPENLMEKYLYEIQAGKIIQKNPGILKESELKNQNFYTKQAIKKNIENLKKALMHYQISDRTIQKQFQNYQNFSLQKIKNFLQPLDIYQLERHITFSKKSSEEIKNKNIILFIGETGAGKTTAIQALLKMKMIQKKLKGMSWIAAENLPNDDKLSRLKSSPEMKSITKQLLSIRLPQQQSQIYLCDTPGIWDTNGPITDLLNSIAIIQAIKNAASIKPIFVISSATWGSRGTNMKKVILLICDLLPNYSFLKDSVTFIFNRFKSQELKECSAKMLNLYENLNLIEKNNNNLCSVYEDLILKTQINTIINLNPMDKQQINKILIKIRSTTPIVDCSNKFQFASNNQAMRKIVQQIGILSKMIKKTYQKNEYVNLRYYIQLTIRLKNLFKGYIHNRIENLNKPIEQLKNIIQNEHKKINEQFHKKIQALSFQKQDAKLLKQRSQKIKNVHKILVQLNLEDTDLTVIKIDTMNNILMDQLNKQFNSVSFCPEIINKIMQITVMIEQNLGFHNFQSQFKNKVQEVNNKISNEYKSYLSNQNFKQANTNLKLLIKLIQILYDKQSDLLKKQINQVRSYLNYVKQKIKYPLPTFQQQLSVINLKSNIQFLLNKQFTQLIQTNHTLATQNQSIKKLIFNYLSAIQTKIIEDINQKSKLLDNIKSKKAEAKDYNEIRKYVKIVKNYQLLSHFHQIQWKIKDIIVKIQQFYRYQKNALLQIFQQLESINEHKKLKVQIPKLNRSYGYLMNLHNQLDKDLYNQIFDEKQDLLSKTKQAINNNLNQYVENIKVVQVDIKNRFFEKNILYLIQIDTIVSNFDKINVKQLKQCIENILITIKQNIKLKIDDILKEIQIHINNLQINNQSQSTKYLNLNCNLFNKILVNIKILNKIHEVSNKVHQNLQQKLKQIGLFYKSRIKQLTQSLSNFFKAPIQQQNQTIKQLNKRIKILYDQNHQEKYQFFEALQISLDDICYIKYEINQSIQYFIYEVNKIIKNIQNQSMLEQYIQKINILELNLFIPQKIKELKSLKQNIQKKINQVNKTYQQKINKFIKQHDYKRLGKLLQEINQQHLLQQYKHLIDDQIIQILNQIKSSRRRSKFNNQDTIQTQILIGFQKLVSIREFLSDYISNNQINAIQQNINQIKSQIKNVYNQKVNRVRDFFNIDLQESCIHIKEVQRFEIDYMNQYSQRKQSESLKNELVQKKKQLQEQLINNYNQFLYNKFFKRDKLKSLKLLKQQIDSKISQKIKTKIQEYHCMTNIKNQQELRDQLKNQIDNLPEVLKYPLEKDLNKTIKKIQYKRSIVIENIESQLKIMNEQELIKKLKHYQETEDYQIFQKLFKEKKLRIQSSLKNCQSSFEQIFHLFTLKILPLFPILPDTYYDLCNKLSSKLDTIFQNLKKLIQTINIQQKQQNVVIEQKLKSDIKLMLNFYENINEYKNTKRDIGILYQKKLQAFLTEILRKYKIMENDIYKIYICDEFDIKIKIGYYQIKIFGSTIHQIKQFVATKKCFPQLQKLVNVSEKDEIQKKLKQQYQIAIQFFKGLNQIAESNYIKPFNSYQNCLQLMNQIKKCKKFISNYTSLINQSSQNIQKQSPNSLLTQLWKYVSIKLKQIWDIPSEQLIILYQNYFRLIKMFETNNYVSNAELKGQIIKIIDSIIEYPFNIEQSMNIIDERESIILDRQQQKKKLILKLLIYKLCSQFNETLIISASTKIQQQLKLIQEKFSSFQPQVVNILNNYGGQLGIMITKQHNLKVDQIMYNEAIEIDLKNYFESLQIKDSDGLQREYYKFCNRYSQFKSLYKNNKTSQDKEQFILLIKNLIKTKAQNLKKINDSYNTKLQNFIFLCSGILSIYYIRKQQKYYPRTFDPSVSQIITIFLFSGFFQETENSKNIVIQLIDDKPFVLAMVSCILILIGYNKISICCSTQYLTKKYQQKFCDIYTILGIEENINYTTMQQIYQKFVSDLKIVDKNNNEQIGNYSKNILLIDQLNVILDKNIFNRFYEIQAKVQDDLMKRLMKQMNQNGQKVFESKEYQEINKNNPLFTYIFKQYFQKLRQNSNTTSENKLDLNNIGLGHFNLLFVLQKFEKILILTNNFQFISSQQDFLKENLNLDKWVQILPTYQRQLNQLNKCIQKSELQIYVTSLLRQEKLNIIIFLDDLKAQQFFKLQSLQKKKNKILITRKTQPHIVESNINEFLRKESGIIIISKQLAIGSQFRINQYNQQQKVNLIFTYTCLDREKNLIVQNLNKNCTYISFIVQQQLKNYGVYINKNSILSANNVIQTNSISNQIKINLQDDKKKIKENKKLAKQLKQKLNDQWKRIFDIQKQIYEIRKKQSEWTINLIDRFINNQESNIDFTEIVKQNDINKKNQWSLRTLILIDGSYPFIKELISIMKFIMIQLFNKMKDKKYSSIQIQIGIFKNYYQRQQNIFQYSALYNRSSKLIDFLNIVDLNYQHGNNSLDIPFNFINQNSTSLNNIILFGHSLPLDQNQRKKQRQSLGLSYWSQSQFKDISSADIQFKQIQKNNIKLNTVYLPSNCSKTDQKLVEYYGNLAKNSDGNFIQIDSLQTKKNQLKIFIQNIVLKYKKSGQKQLSRMKTEIQKNRNKKLIQ